MEATDVPERFKQVNGQGILTLENLVIYIEKLHQLRKDILQYLEFTIKAREDTLMQMRVLISKVKSDDFFYPDA